MTEQVRWAFVALVIVAILILPSPVLAVGNQTGEIPDGGESLVPWKDQEYNASFAFAGLNSSVAETVAAENRTVSHGSPPEARDSAVTTGMNIPVEIVMDAMDPDKDILTFDIVSSPLNGTLGVVTGDRVLYTPLANYTGDDSFNWRASDGYWVSETATITVIIGPDCIAAPGHRFFGSVTIDGAPAPENVTVTVTGEGVRMNMTGDTVFTDADGSYGSTAGGRMFVQGCTVNGTALSFFVDGLQAEVLDANVSGPWQTVYPFNAGGETRLDLRVRSPPDTVYINAIGVTVSNSSMGFFQTVQVEKNPWMELRVSGGMFEIGISATGYHDFFDLPLLSRNATLGIYEDGRPVSKEVNVVFGSRTATFQYIANETRTLDILIYVNEQPEIHDAKRMTIYVGPNRNEMGDTEGHGGKTSPFVQWLASDRSSLPHTDIGSII